MAVKNCRRAGCSAKAIARSHYCSRHQPTGHPWRRLYKKSKQEARKP